MTVTTAWVSTVAAVHSLRGWRFVFGVIVTLWLLFGTPLNSRAADPAQGPGGPILILTSSSSVYGTYYAEILRTEGFNAFTVADIGSVSPSTLAAYDVVLLAKTALTTAQVTTLTDWVNGGGNLIAMAPDAKMAGLLGVTPAGGTLSEGYLQVDTSVSPGEGIVAQTMQFHGSADLYVLNGAAVVATLFSTATTATSSPAVTLRNAGSGSAAAFAYDLATSVVYTRQGNPAWASQERDGFSPIRSDDKFYGAAAGDIRPDWVDLGKVAIPQADEQQRLLANLITSMNAARKPLPRFWYLPNGMKAVVVMSGDDHGNGGTAGRFDQFKAQGPANCSVAKWECIRGTSYMYPSTPLSNAQVAQYVTDGFEVGLHISTGCSDYTAASLQTIYDQQVPTFMAQFPSAGALKTQRHHCIAWSDWSSGAQVQLTKGMRLDTSYYFWPPSWVADAPGLFTGSAMPMRFAKLDGSLVDVFMAATQMTDESGQSYPATVDTLLDRALGLAGYYGVYTVNAHTDAVASAVADAVVASARARGVSVISAQQLLTWIDARNASAFGALSMSAGSLSFTVVKDSAAEGLQAMLPLRSGSSVLSGITRAGSAVALRTATIKGVDYAFFAADAGPYVASYGADTFAPSVVATKPGAGASSVAGGSNVTATFSEEMIPSTINATTVELRDAAGTLVNAVVGYDAATRTATLTPGAALAASTDYIATVRGGVSGPRVQDLAGNALAANFVWSFKTAAPPPPLNCPCTAWSSSTTPTTAQASDPNAVELGVKFRSDVGGAITGLRFYKGPNNTGTHIGNLWSSSGARLATATFTGESASGWQQINFSTPVAISANVVYVASYFAPNGNYAGDGAYFATAGVDNGPIHLLSNASSGGNGVYQYAASSTFPASSYNATNYWVDVVFSAGGSADTTPPTVTTTAPAQGATGVAIGATISATFSEALDPASVGTQTLELRDAANAIVASSVTYNASTRSATLTPSAALAPSATYTALVRGGTTDPRIKDLAGNALAANVTWTFTTAATGGGGGGGGGCGAPANAVVAENCLAGNPASEWDVSGIGDPSIQGFATDISVNRSETVSFKVKTTANNYRFDIYRMGYYGGQGARKVASVMPSAALPQDQPACLNNTATGLIDCGNWAVSGSWAVPATATSGIYFAKVIRTDTGGASHIVFVVRNDASTAPLLFQTSDTTWQAYNDYGGNSLYKGSPAGRAYKVSYNRPFATRAVDGGQDWLFNAEYPMVRFLESNGYDISYATGLDSDRLGTLIANHKMFLSVGHDEYWSAGQRASVTAARNAGVNLAFFSGNEVFWKTRWEPSIDASATPNRTLVCYKETHANAKIDPTSIWTGTWRDPRFSPPADGGRPENELTGTLFMVNDGATTSITVPAADGKMRFWRNTSIASLTPGASATLPNGTLGYEWDLDVDNGARPVGLLRMSTTTVPNASLLQDQGSTYAPGTAVHSLTMYRHSSGARVFGAGTIQWAWGLDAVHDRAGTAADARMRQATVNLLADMDVQPATLQPGLLAASPSTDLAAPASTITSPSAGSTVTVNSSISVSGTASDSGGGVVGGIEVSVDNGTTWHPAVGRESWSFDWMPSTAGSYTIKTRAVDDSGNVEIPGPGAAVTVGSGAPQVCPCTLFPSSAVPASASDPDTGSVNLGVRFTADQAGMISGIRFYKGAANTGTHVGSLWSSTGTLLASATFTGETASGWQQVNFATPIAVNANTVYVASYLAPAGRYAVNLDFFASSGVDRVPLHAPAGSNGVYAYAGSTTFPGSTFRSSNYWVDVVFSPGAAPADTTPPTITARSPANGATGVSATANVTATFSEPMDPATISASSFLLRDSGGTAVPATITYNATTRVATLNPTPALGSLVTYTATVLSGATGVKDAAGNALAIDSSWSFTVVADTKPPTITSVSPASGATGVSRGANVTATFSEAIDPATINTTTFTLRSAANATVNATVTYNATNRSAVLNPDSNLTAVTAYTATVKGGSTDPRVKDAAGNALAADRTWTFITR